MPPAPEAGALEEDPQLQQPRAVGDAVAVSAAAAEPWAPIGIDPVPAPAAFDGAAAFVREAAAAAGSPHPSERLVGADALLALSSPEGMLRSVEAAKRLHTRSLYKVGDIPTRTHTHANTLSHTTQTRF